MHINIRPETTDDIKAIHTLTIAAFKDAAHTEHSEHFVVMGLRDAGVLTLSLVAELDDVIVGHVAVSPITISDHTPHWYGLGPLSVTPELHHQGIGSQLMHEALAQLKKLGAGGCVLLGDPNYYYRFGFKAIPGLTLPEIPVEFFQAVSFTGDFPQGIVSFHDAFVAQY